MNIRIFYGDFVSLQGGPVLVISGVITPLNGLGVITLLIGVITPLITSRGPPCTGYPES